MKQILLTIFVLLTFWIVLSKLTHYNQRMEQYNAYVCAVEGYQPDCKTPLEGGENK